LVNFRTKEESDPDSLLNVEEEESMNEVDELAKRVGGSDGLTSVELIRGVCELVEAEVVEVFGTYEKDKVFGTKEVGAKEVIDVCFISA